LDKAPNFFENLWIPGTWQFRLLLRPSTTDIPLAEKVTYPNGLSTEQSRNPAALIRLHGMQDISSTMQQHEQNITAASNSQCEGMQKGSNKLMLSASYKTAICHISS
jgi:hypothetical protein